MAIKPRLFGQAIDLNKNELQNAVVQNLSSAPSSPVEGQIYFDTTLRMFGVYQNSSWAYHADKTFLLARANHTGTQLAATISDFDTQVRTSRLDQMASPTGDVSMGSHKLTNVLAPTIGTDAANMQYVDDKVAGLSWKDEVKAATTANGTLATAYANGQTVDGYTLVTGDRILIKNQTTGSENGIYTVNASGAPTRATDADTGPKMLGAAVYIVNGTTNGAARYTCNNTGAITIGTTALTFASFGGGNTYTAGNGLALAGSSFSVTPDTGIAVTGSGVKVDVAVVVRKYAAAFGDGSSTSFVINHALNSQDCHVQIYRNSGTYEQVEFDVQHTDANNVTIYVAGLVPSSNQFKVVVHV